MDKQTWETYRDHFNRIKADEYGNGVVGAWNRKGKGRTLQPGN